MLVNQHIFANISLFLLIFYVYKLFVKSSSFSLFAFCVFVCSPAALTTRFSFRLFFRRVLFFVSTNWALVVNIICQVLIHIRVREQNTLCHLFVSLFINIVALDMNPAVASLTFNHRTPVGETVYSLAYWAILSKISA